MTNQNTRREFFKETGRKALWVAPTVAVLMTASSQPAKATGRYHSGGSSWGSSTGSKLKSLFKIKKK